MPRVDAGGSSILWLAAMLVNVELKEIIAALRQAVLTDTDWHRAMARLARGAPAATRFQANRAPNWSTVDAASASASRSLDRAG